MVACSQRGFLWLSGALATGAIIAALAPAAAFGSFPGGNGVIAYSGESLGFEPAETEQYQGIWAVDPKTGYQLRLTSGPDFAPSFSPSGNLLAFQRGYGGPTTTIFLARADGSDARPLVKGLEPAFSPDGKEIVFVRPGGLYVTGLAPGSPVRRITDHPGDFAPTWNSSGTIAFERGDSRYGLAIDTITPPRLKVREIITYDNASEMFPEWSPNGKTLSVALCDSSVKAFTLKGSPSLAISSDCFPRVFAPQGRGVASIGVGVLAGSPFESCPPGSGSFDISWQPLVAGTMRIHTVKCEGTRPPRSGPTSSSSPSKSSEGSKWCVPGKHGHGKICHKVP
jgi:Tol biopolymer transport system component